MLTTIPALAVQTGTRIDAFGGNVGIGTTTPQGALTVNNGNVGIGTWTTGQILDVVGTFKAVSFLGDGSSMTGLLSNGWTKSANDVYLTTATNNLGLGTTTPQGKLIISNGNVGIGTWSPSALLQINALTGNPMVVNSTGNVGLGTASPQSSLAVTSGNVGIGTFAPAALWQVNGQSNSPVVLGADGNLGLSTVTPQAKFIALDNIGIGTWSAQGGHLIINSGGNVGINSAWPGQSLDINGSFRVMNGSSSNYFQANVGINTSLPGKEMDISGTARATVFEGDGSTLTNVANAGGWTTSGASVYVTTRTNNVGIGTVFPQTWPSILGNVGIGTWAPEGALVIRRGNVGIGLTTPNRLLYLIQTVSGLTYPLKLDNYAESSQTGILFSVAGDGAGNLQTDRGKGGLAYYSQGTGNWNKGDFMFLQNSAADTSNPSIDDAVMTITNEGNVGIGTTTPQGKLVVFNGNLGIGTFEPNRQVYIASNPTGLDYPLKLDNYSATNAQTGILFSVNGDETGNLDSSRGKGAIAYIMDASGWNRGDFHLLQDPNADTGLADLSDSVMTFKNDTNIGIGTITPVGKLIIAAGGVGLGTSKNSSIIQTSVSAGSLISDGNIGVGTTTPQAMLTTGNLTIGTWNSGGENLIIRSGNMGIGTAWPGAALDVIDDIRGTSYSMPGNISSGTNSIAMGYAPAINNIVSSGTGSVASGRGLTSTNLGQVSSTGLGSIAWGLGWGSVSGSAVILSSGSGSLAGGYANSATSITSSNLGSLALGYAFGSTDLLTSSGIASVAIGQGVTATANNALSFGKSVQNNNASTFMVGFNATPTMTVTSANVGISTYDPLSTLVVTAGGLGIGTNQNSSFIQTTAPLGGMIVESNLGVGTATPQSTFIVMGNAGIGTWTANSGNLIVNGSGNVGIASAWPGSKLDVIGTVRATVFAGDASLISNAGSSGAGWTTSGSTVYVNTVTNNIGIGTTAPQAKLVVYDGNVGIGTWTADNGSLIVKRGNVGIGTALVPTTWSIKGSVSQIVVNNTDAASVSTNAALGNYFRWTTTQDFTLANPTNPTDGQKIIWEIIQDGAGNHAITLGNKFMVGSDISSVVLTTTATKRDFLTAAYSAVDDKWYVIGFVKGY